MALVAATGAVVVAGGVGVYFWRSAALEARLERDLAAGVEAVDRESWEKGLDLIGPYLARNKDDLEALLPYAVARQHVELPNNKHITDSMKLLRRVLELDPNNAEARRALLALYVRTGQTPEILSTTEGRTDLDSLQARAIALTRVGRTDEAMQVVRQYAEQRPDDFRMQRFALSLLENQGRTEAALEQIDALEQAAGESPTFTLLRVGVLRSAGRTAEADALMEELLAVLRANEASLLKQQQPIVVWELIDRLNAEDRYDDSLWALTAYASRPMASDGEVDVVEEGGLMAEIGAEVSTTTVRLRALEQLLIAGRGEEALRLAEGWDLTNRRFTVADVAQVRAMLALAAAQAGDKAAAAKWLEGQSGEWSAFAQAAIDAGWPTTLSTPPEMLSPEWNPETDQAAALLQAATELADSATAARSPLPDQAAGDAVASLGEPRAALSHWQSAATTDATWARPRIRAGEMLLAAGRMEDARDLAEAALRRSPNDADALLLRVEADLFDQVPPDAERALADLDRVQAANPSAVGQLLPARLAALRAAGQTAEAQTLLSQSLASGELSTKELGNLLGAARRLDDGALEDVVDALRQRDDAASMLPLATYYASRDEMSEVDRLADLARRRSGADWQRARAELALVQNDPQAGRLWQELADAHPKDLGLQRRALLAATEAAPTDAFTAQEQLDFARRAAARVRTRIGEASATSVELPLARAQLMAAGNDREQVAAAAVQLQKVVNQNPQYLEARLLLADALVRLGNDEAANAELRRALDAAPGAITLRLALAERLIAAGNFNDADLLIELAQRQMSGDPASVTPRDRRTLSRLLTARNRPADAAMVLAGIQGEARTGFDRTSEARARLVAGTLTADEVEQLLQAVAEASEQAQINAHDVALAFYQRAGNAERVAELRQSLETTANSNSEAAHVAALALARSAAIAGDAAMAQQWYTQATKAAPNDVRGWAGLARVQLFNGDVSGFVNAAASTPAGGEGHAALRWLGDAMKNDADLRAAAQNPSARRILASLLPGATEGSVQLSGERVRQDLVHAGKLVADGELTTKGLLILPSQNLRELESLATRHPGVVPLQVAVLRGIGASGRTREALGTAARIVEQFPGEAEIVKAATEVADANEQYPQAANFAARWAKIANSPHERLAASLAVARAQMKANNPAAAEAALRPFVATFGSLPPEDWNAQYDAVEVLKVYGPAAVASGRAQAAHESLRGHLGQLEIRGLFRELIGYGVPAAQVADWIADLDASASTQQDPLKDRVSIALALATAADRLDDAALRTQAVDRLKPLAEEALAVESTPVPILFGLGYGLETAGTGDATDLILRLYRDALRRDPQYVQAAIQLATLLGEQGDTASLAEAIQVGRQGVDRARGDLQLIARERLATLLAQSGKVNEAVEQLQQAVQIPTEDAALAFEVRLRLAEVLADAGDFAAAEEQLVAVREQLALADQAQRERIDALTSRIATASA